MNARLVIVLPPAMLLMASCLAQAQVALPRIQDVRFDDAGGFIVNGEPFFPILLYGAAVDEEMFTQLKAFGFNVLAVTEPQVAEILPDKGFYAVLHVRKEIDDVDGVLLSLGHDSPALRIKENLIERTLEDNAKTRLLIAGRPVMNAIGYWENEPAGVKAGQLYAKEKYADLTAAIELPAPYLYPVPYQPVSTVGDAVAVVKKAGGKAKPVLPILQLFVWDAKDRYPTPAELRAMAFAALIEGAGGIGYFSYSTVTGHKGRTIAEIQPELWQSVKQLNADIIKSAQILRGASDERITATDAADIRWKAVVFLNGGHIVAVNQSNEPRTLTLAVPPEAQLREPWKISDGAASIEMQPFEIITTTYGTR